MRLPLFLACYLIGTLALAQVDPKSPPPAPEVFIDEIIRRGDMVEHVTGEMSELDESQSLIRQVTDHLPESDKDKWNIYVVGMKGCIPCKALYEAWKTDPVLRAYAKPDEPNNSWANFHYYRYDDELQKWRWTKGPDNPNALEITEFPTVVCQPPRNGKWTDTDVVYADVYPGDSKKFSRDLNAMIKAYVAKVQPKHAAAEHQEFPPAKDGVYSLEGHGPQAEVEPPKLGVAAIGQKISPLNLPNDEPDDEPEDKPDRRKLIERRGEEIVIVKDPEGVYGTEDLDAMQSMADELQPEFGPKLKIRSIDPSKAEKLYDVDPTEVPVVLKVDGDDVREKRKPNVNSEKGFLGTLFFIAGLWLVYKQFGGLVAMIFGLLGFAIMVLIICLIGPPLVRLMRRAYASAMGDPAPGTPAPAPVAPAATPAAASNAAAELAELEAKLAIKAKQLEYEKLTAELVATKKANGA